MCMLQLTTYTLYDKINSWKTIIDTQTPQYL